MLGLLKNGGAAGCPQRPPLRRLALGLCLVAWTGAAAALEIGSLHWRTPPGQPPFVEIELLDKLPIDPAAVRGRLAARESYDVAGLIYDPRLSGVQIKPQQAPDGRVWLRLDRLPADAASLDLLVTVSDRMALALAEFHLDLRQGPFDVAPSPAGTRLGSKPGPARVAAPAAPAAATPPERAAVAGPQAAAAPADAELAAAHAAVLAWAAAWSRRDVDAYLAAYAPDYAGRGELPSRAAWVAQRRERIAARRSIVVEITALKLARQGPQVIATFQQHYRADSFDERVRKRLVLANVDGRWLIHDESERH